MLSTLSWADLHSRVIDLCEVCRRCQQELGLKVESFGHPCESCWELELLMIALQGLDPGVKAPRLPPVSARAVWDLRQSRLVMPHELVEEEDMLGGYASEEWVEEEDDNAEDGGLGEEDDFCHDSAGDFEDDFEDDSDDNLEEDPEYGSPS
jgi:hypothetical protein